jgi:hypothetical protein
LTNLPKVDKLGVGGLEKEREKKKKTHPTGIKIPRKQGRVTYLGDN